MLPTSRSSALFYRCGDRPVICAHRDHATTAAAPGLAPHGEGGQLHKAANGGRAEGRGHGERGAARGLLNAGRKGKEGTAAAGEGKEEGKAARGARAAGGGAVRAGLRAGAGGAEPGGGRERPRAERSSSALGAKRGRAAAPHLIDGGPAGGLVEPVELLLQLHGGNAAPGPDPQYPLLRQLRLQLLPPRPRLPALHVTPPFSPPELRSPPRLRDVRGGRSRGV